MRVYTILHNHENFTHFYGIFSNGTIRQELEYHIYGIPKYGQLTMV